MGNPFRAVGVSAEKAAAAYGELPGGARSAHEIARARGLTVHETQGSVTHDRRMGALMRLVARVRAGEHVCVRCPCAQSVCHSSLVREWVARELARG